MPSALSLEDLVRRGTFRSRRHHELLAGAVMPWPELAQLQARYLNAGTDQARREIGVLFERRVRELQEAFNAVDHELAQRLEAILAEPPTVFVDGRDAGVRVGRAVQAEWRRNDGWTSEEIAAELKVAPATIRRDLRYLEKYRAETTPSGDNSTPSE